MSMELGIASKQSVKTNVNQEESLVLQNNYGESGVSSTCGEFLTYFFQTPVLSKKIG